MKKNWCCWTGTGMGSIALMLALIHFMAGPFSAQPPLEEIIATNAVAIKQATLAALRGKKEVMATPPDSLWDKDRMLSAAIAALAAGAVILGVLGGMVHKENRRVATAAVLLGIATVELQFAAMVLSVVLLLVLIAGVISLLSG